MRAVQRQNDSLDLLCRHVAELERQRREPGQQELWQERLSTLQHWICELLIDNELLRASGKTSTSFQPEADPGHAVGIVTPAMSRCILCKQSAEEASGQFELSQPLMPKQGN